MLHIYKHIDVYKHMVLMYTQVSRLRSRKHLPCGNGGLKTGGPITTWQTRLSTFLGTRTAAVPPSPPVAVQE